jgi:hypothetical protein
LRQRFRKEILGKYFGTVAIAAGIENLTGVTNAFSINVVGITNSDGSMNSPVQLQAMPVAGFAPLPGT